jgi:hypothetical protein
MGYGDDATCFRYTDHEVAKLCSTEIKYFRDTPHASASHFYQLVNSLQPILLPINRVLYEDADVFVYTQPFCEKFNRRQLTKNQLNEIITIEQTLLRRRLRASTSAHNLGLYQGHVVIFDYHDIRPIEQDKHWRQAVNKHLFSYLSRYYSCKNVQEHLPSHCQRFMKQLIDPSLSPEDLLETYDQFLSDNK